MARSLAALLLLLVAAVVISAQYEDDSVGTVFFLPSDLHPGSKMTLHFTRPAAGATIALPSATAARAADYSSIPFTSAKIAEILSRLSIPSNSPAATAIRATLAQCEAPAAPGVEALHCVTSYGSMADFAAASLGTRDVRAARTRLAGATTATPKRQAYEVGSVRTVPVAGGDMVACHRLPYPYDVFACHTTTAAVYAVSLATSAGDGTTTSRAEALAACHADAFPGISKQAYEKLGVKPGSAPVCHFLPQDSTLWMRN